MTKVLMWTCTNLQRLLRPGSHLRQKALANEDTLLRTHNNCLGHKFCVRDTKNVSDFVQKHFVSATNVSQFAQAQPKKHHEQQCVRNNMNNVSSFASTYNDIKERSHKPKNTSC